MLSNGWDLVQLFAAVLPRRTVECFLELHNWIDAGSDPSEREINLGVKS